MVTHRFACILFILCLTACGGSSGNKTNETPNNTAPPIQPAPTWSVTQPKDIILTNIAHLNFYFDIKGVEHSELTISADNLPAFVKLKQTEEQLSYLEFVPTYQKEPSAFSFPVTISDGKNEKSITIKGDIKTIISPPERIAITDRKSCSYKNNKLSCWGRKASTKVIGTVTKLGSSQEGMCWLADDKLGCDFSRTKLFDPEPLPFVGEANITDFALTQSKNPTQVCVIQNNEIKCEGKLKNIPKLEGTPIQLAAGFEHVCALIETKTKNKVQCWGDTYYEYNNIPDLTSPTAIAAAEKYSCVIDDGKVKCWGSPDFRTVSNLPNDLDNPYLISLGETQACAATDSGVVCWGTKIHLNTDNLTAPEVKGQVVSMDSAHNQNCLVDEQALKCWGTGKYYFSAPHGTIANPQKLSIGDDFLCSEDNTEVKCIGKNNVNQIVPPKHLSNVDKLVSGEIHTCALKNEKVQCWGNYSIERFKEPANLTKVTDITSGNRHVCAISNGQIICWGHNDLGQLDVPNNIGSPKALFAGNFHTCVTDNSDNGVTCWGHNLHGESEPPRKFNNIKYMALGFAHTCIEDEKELTCWGDNRIIAPPLDKLKNIQEMAAIDRNTCAISDNKVVCWGFNSSELPKKIPTDLISPKNLVMRYDTACVTDNEAIRCWGDLTY